VFCYALRRCTAFAFCVLVKTRSVFVCVCYGTLRCRFPARLYAPRSVVRLLLRSTALRFVRSEQTLRCPPGTGYAFAFTVLLLLITPRFRSVRSIPVGHYLQCVSRTLRVFFACVSFARNLLRVAAATRLLRLRFTDRSDLIPLLRFRSRCAFTLPRLRRSCMHVRSSTPAFGRSLSCTPRAFAFTCVR